MLWILLSHSVTSFTTTLDMEKMWKGETIFLWPKMKLYQEESASPVVSWNSLYFQPCFPTPISMELSTGNPLVLLMKQFDFSETNLIWKIESKFSLVIIQIHKFMLKSHFDNPEVEILVKEINTFSRDYIVLINSVTITSPK